MPHDTKVVSLISLVLDTVLYTYMGLFRITNVTYSQRCVTNFHYLSAQISSPNPTQLNRQQLSLPGCKCSPMSTFQFELRAAYKTLATASAKMNCGDIIIERIKIVKTVWKFSLLFLN